jgi:N-acetylglutamate synthase-like GNAT family acetyltransferase
MGEARERRLRYVFACTTEQRAASLFGHLGFAQVGPRAVAPAKWRGYDRQRLGSLRIFRSDLAG